VNKSSVQQSIALEYVCVVEPDLSWLGFSFNRGISCPSVVHVATF